MLGIEKLVDDPVGALSAHGLAGIWGTLAFGIFASPRLVSEGAGPGLWYAISATSLQLAFGQLGAQALGVVVAFVVVFAISYATFSLMKKTIGLRVPPEEEDAGLDISGTGCTATRSSSSRSRSTRPGLPSRRADRAARLARHRPPSARR